MSIVCLIVPVIFTKPVNLQNQDIYLPVLQTGHTGRIITTVISPNNQIVVTGGSEGTIKFWERNTGLLSITIKAHLGKVNSLSFSPDGQFVASAGDDGVIHLWSIKTGKLEQSYKGHTSPVSYVTFSADGDFLASGGGSYGEVGGISDNTVRLWERSSGKLLNVFRGHQERIQSVAFNGKGDRIVSGSFDKNIKIWSVSSNQPLLTIKTEAYASVAFSPDGKTIASAEPEKVVFWNALSGREQSSISHKNFTTDITFTSDWRLLFIGINVWNVENKQFIKSIKTYAETTSVSQDGAYLVAAGVNQLAVWDINRSIVVQNFEGKSKTPHYTTGVTFSKTGKKAAWIGVIKKETDQDSNYGDSIYIWNVEKGNLQNTFAGEPYLKINEVIFSPDEKLLVSCGDYGVDIWSLATGKLMESIYDNKNTLVGCESVAFSPDGSLLAVAGVIYNKKRNSEGEIEVNHATGILGIQVLEIKNWKLIHNLKIPAPISEAGTSGIFRAISFNRGDPTNVVHSVAFSPDGRLLVSGDDYKSVRVWNVRTGKIIRILNDHTYGVNSVSFDSSGKKIVSGSFDKTVKVWDSQSGRLLQTLEGHAEQVSSVKFTPDGQSVVSGSYDQTIRIWDINLGKTKAILQGHTGIVTFVAISPDGRNIMSASMDGLLNIWSISQSTLISSIFIPADNGWINFTPDGYYTESLGAAKYLAWKKGNQTSQSFAKNLLNPEILLARFRGATPVFIPEGTSPPINPPINPPISESEKMLRLKWKEHRFFALVIGNNKYQKLKPLENSVNDATEVGRILKERYGFQVKLLIDATKEEIMDALQLHERITDENSSFLIYYAGHGSRLSNIKKTYWQPVDADSINRNNWISSDQIFESLNLNKSRHILVVSDSCFAGGLTRSQYSNPTSDDPPDALLRLMERKSRTLIASGGIEPVDDGGEDGHSVFGGLFIKGLNKMPQNIFIADRLFYEYIYDGVLERAKQTPEINDILYFTNNSNEDENHGKFIFVKK